MFPLCKKEAGRFTRFLLRIIPLYLNASVLNDPQSSQELLDHLKAVFYFLTLTPEMSAF